MWLHSKYMLQKKNTGFYLIRKKVTSKPIRKFTEMFSTPLACSTKTVCLKTLADVCNGKVIIAAIYKELKCHMPKAKKKYTVSATQYYLSLFSFFIILQNIWILFGRKSSRIRLQTRHSSFGTNPAFFSCHKNTNVSNYITIKNHITILCKLHCRQTKES